MLRARSALLAPLLWVGFVAAGCGVLTSGRCEDKATCLPEDSTLGSAGSEGGSQGPGADANAPGAPPSDASLAADSSPLQSGTLDSGKAVGTGGRPPLGAADAACVPGATENCSNGIDDNCDGLVDCADPDCSGFTCAPAAPEGWVGPVALWQGEPTSTPPACDAEFTPALAAVNGGLAFSPAVCTCTCGASGQVCSTTQDFFIDMACASACSTPTATGGVCTAIQSGCGEQGSFSASTPVATGGTCIQDISKTVLPATWGREARACAWAGPVDIPGGCADSGAECVAKPSSLYGSTLCVYSALDPAPTVCPAGFNKSGPFTYFSAMNDTRNCGDCGCIGPMGGSCAGSVDVYSGNTCGAVLASYSAFGSCAKFSSSPGSVQGDFTLQPGSCRVVSEPPAVGTVVGIGPRTVCCM